MHARRRETMTVVTVVIAEDDPDTRGMLCRLVRRSFPCVRIAQSKDGLAAHRRLLDLAPRLVIVDLHMPKMDGPALCRFIQSHPRLAKTRVLVLTADTSAKARRVMFETGTSEFLTKPFDSDELVSSVTRLLA